MHLIAIALAIVLLAGILVTEVLSRKYWHVYLRRHPAPAYQAATGSAWWHWGAPPMRLRVHPQDENSYSRLLLPHVAKAMNQMTSLIGLAIALLGLTVLVQLALDPLHERLAVVGFFGAFLLIAGRALLFVDARLVAIELAPEHVTFILRYGIVLEQHVTLHANQIAGFSGKPVAPAWSWNKPSYIFSVKQRWLSKVFASDCKPPEGGWVLEGLKNWQQMYARHNVGAVG
jgi:hypothetical protein